VIQVKNEYTARIDPGGRDKLTVEFRQPFDLLVVGADSNGNAKAASSDTDGLFSNWLPIVDTFRTFCLAPTPQIRATFEQVHELAPS
jgi:hypothetical protein